MALDKWWSFIQQTCKFDTLLNCLTAALSCFHRPSVESTFSVMSTILDSHSPTTLISSYIAIIQTVKHQLMVDAKTSIQTYFHEDSLKAKVSGVLCKNMSLVYQEYTVLNSKHREKMRKPKHWLLRV